MSEINIILPKLHVFFRTTKTRAQVRSEVLGPLATRYENGIQQMLDNAGETDLTARVTRTVGKISKHGPRWELYLKCGISGTTNKTERQLRQAWGNRKADIKSRIISRMSTFGGTDLRFRFRRLDNQESVEES